MKTIYRSTFARTESQTLRVGGLAQSAIFRSAKVGRAKAWARWYAVDRNEFRRARYARACRSRRRRPLARISCRTAVRSAERVPVGALARTRNSFHARLLRDGARRSKRSWRPRRGRRGRRSAVVRRRRSDPEAPGRWRLRYARRPSRAFRARAGVAPAARPWVRSNARVPRRSSEC